MAFEHTIYDLHLTKLLEKVKPPTREVEDVEIFSTNRRFFNGERAIKMLEGILGFESTLSGVSRGV